MARSQLKNLFASLESEEEIREEGDGLVGGVDSMETAVMDVEESYREVEALEEDVEELEEIEEGLEVVVESLQAALEQGGLDPVAAQFAHHAVEAYTARLGIESTAVMPALESFGGDSGRAAATEVSLEGIGETLKRIWAAIKAAVEKAIKAVTDFFAKVFGGIAKVKTRIADLEKSVADIKKESKKVDAKAKVKVGSPNSLQLAGKVDAGALTKGMSNLVDANKTMFVDYLGAIDDVYKKAADEVGKLKDKDEDSAAEEAARALTASETTLLKKAEKSAGVALPGDKTVVTAKTEDRTTVTIGAAPKARAFQGEASIDPLTVAQMEALLKDAGDIAGRVEGAKAAIEQAKKAREAAMDAAKKVADASASGRVGKVWTKTKAHMVLKAAQREYLRPVTQLTSLNFSVLRSVLAVVESSTKQYKVEAAA